jgi:hypothetical protein
MDTPINIHPDEASLILLAKANAIDDAHLRACERCRMIVAFYQVYLEEERKSFAQPMTEREAQRAEDLLFPGVHRLLPFQTHVPVQDLHTGESAYLLAALNTSADTSRFQPVASFASESIRTVVRVIRDVRSGTYTFFVLAEDPSLSHRVKIGVNDIDGHQVQIETDADGVGSMDDGLPIDWKNAHLFLITPPTSRS